MPRVVRGGARNNTFDLFARAIKNPIPKRVPLLLVDSEDTIHADYSVWQHLHARGGWHQPPGAHADQAFLMVRVMETWFLADRQSLKGYFDAGFAENKIRQWPRLEDVPKATVLNSLQEATARCREGYAKGRVSFKLLARIDPACVEAACPSAKALGDRLKTL